MKLSENTLSTLKNFAAINSGVVLAAGSAQRTISPEKSILVEAMIDDDIPTQFGIYDLNQFLGNLTTLRNPELTFGKEGVVLDDGELSFEYRACSGWDCGYCDFDSRTLGVDSQLEVWPKCFAQRTLQVGCDGTTWTCLRYRKTTCLLPHRSSWYPHLPA